MCRYRQLCLTTVTRVFADVAGPSPPPPDFVTETLCALLRDGAGDPDLELDCDRGADEFVMLLVSTANVAGAPGAAEFKYWAAADCPPC